MKGKNFQSVDEIDWFDPASLVLDKATEIREFDKMRESSGYKANMF